MIYLLLASEAPGKSGQALAFKQLEFGSSSQTVNSGEPIPRIDKIEVFASAKHSNLGSDIEIGVLSQRAALDATHALLSAQPLLWHEEKLGPLWVDFYLDSDVNTEIRGDSGGLAYSLCLLAELTKFDNDGSQRFADTHNSLNELVIGATGTIDVLGRVGHVNGVEAKLTAFVDQIQKDWTDIQHQTGLAQPRIAFLLPKENLEQLDPECLEQAQQALQTLSPNLDIVGISELAEAIQTLVGDKFPIAQQDLSPYKGLSAFEPQDRLLFFGREKKVNDTLAKLTEHAAIVAAHRHCLVFGDSGSGKSSFVKAGLLPRLSRQKDSALQNWAILKPGDAQGQLLDYFIHCLRPTLDAKDQDQLDALPWRKDPQSAVQGFMTLYRAARATSDHSSSTESKSAVSSPVFVLVIDQAEELLRTQAAKNEIKAFKALIRVFSTCHLSPNPETEQPEPVTWVISAIRLSEYESYKSFLALENEQAQYLACPLAVLDPSDDIAAYRAIIENPARLRGIAVEPELTQHLLATIIELKNPLPTLEYTLHELYWHAVKTHSLAKGLTLSAFKDEQVIGSMSGLITRNAQALLDELKQEKPLRKRIGEFFSLLLGVDKTHGLPYPKPAKIDAFKKPAELNRLYQAFVNHRFLLDSDNNVRFCHEVLIREWRAVQSWAAKTALKERNRKVRNLLGGLVFSIGLVLIASYAAYYANQQTDLAKKERNQALINQSRFLADLSRKYTERGNTRLGALLALEALPDYSKKIEDRRPLVSEAAASINQVINHPIDIAWFRHTDIVNRATFSPDGRHIVTASEDHTARIWDANTGNLLAVLQGHTDKVRSAVYNPQGNRIVTASFDNTARIWNADTGQQMSILEGHSGFVNAASYSPDGRYIVTASNDGARTWDAETGKLLSILEGHTDLVVSAAYSPDGHHIVTASFDNTARIWNAEIGQQMAILEGHSGFVNTASYSPDGRIIVTSSKDKTARIWNAETGQLITVLEGHSDHVDSAAYSQDGHHIVTASWDDTARIWNSETWQIEAVLKGHTANVNTAAFSPDGHHIVTASDDGARIWNAETGEPVSVISGHPRYVNTAEFSPDGRHIVTASWDGTAHLTALDIPRSIIYLKGHTGEINTVVYNPDGHSIVTASKDKTARIWNAETGQLVAALKGHTGSVNTAVYSPDGQYVVTASQDKTARIWNAETTQFVAELKGHTGEINAVAYSPDGHHIVTASWDKTAQIWNAETGQPEHKLNGHIGSVDAVAYSPDGGHIVTISLNTGQIWDVKNGKLETILEGHTSFAVSATYSPDGRHLLTVALDHTPRIWDAENGKLVALLEGHTKPINMATYSPDGHQVVTASFDATARIWNAHTGHLLAVLTGHTDNVHTAAYSPNGRHIVTASNDKTARIWGAETGQLETVLEGHTGYVKTAAFSPDGRHIVTASWDGTAQIWTLYDIETIIEKIKRLNLSPLTPEEQHENYLD